MMPRFHAAVVTVANPGEVLRLRLLKPGFDILMQRGMAG
jgi:hypothetical protein